MPFAVVGSTEEVSVGNKMVKARQYPWGVVQGRVRIDHRGLVCVVLQLNQNFYHGKKKRFKADQSITSFF